MLYHCTMCTRHPDLVSLDFYAIPIFPENSLVYIHMYDVHVYATHEPERAPLV